MLNWRCLAGTMRVLKSCTGERTLQTPTTSAQCVILHYFWPHDWRSLTKLSRSVATLLPVSPVVSCLQNSRSLVQILGNCFQKSAWNSRISVLKDFGSRVSDLGFWWVKFQVFWFQSRSCASLSSLVLGFKSRDSSSMSEVLQIVYSGLLSIVCTVMVPAWKWFFLVLFAQ